MEPYSWAEQVIEQFNALRDKGSPYAFVRADAPSWAAILKELLASHGFAEGWVTAEGSCIFVKFPEN